jgi:hypothetical protein
LGEEDYSNITGSLYKLNAVEKLSYNAKKLSERLGDMSRSMHMHTLETIGTGDDACTPTPALNASLPHLLN